MDLRAIGYYLVCLIFTIGGVIMIYTENHIIGWMSAIFFGLGTILFTIKLIYPKFKYFNLDHIKEEKPLSEEEFAERYKADGIFSYTSDGFELELQNENLKAKWGEIETLVGYKVDLITYDQICLDVFLSDDRSFSINEETHGWYNFQERTIENLNISNPNWWLDIATPAFEANHTAVYDFKNRPIEEITKENYKA